MSELMLSERDQHFAFCIIHQTINHYVRIGKRYDPKLNEFPQTFCEPRGVFITLYISNENGEELRGCVGFPLPTFPLAKAIAYATYSSLINDPRFPPVEPDELNNMIVEVEILSPMKKIDFETLYDLYNQIEIGKDGLLLQAKNFSGLLLPTVPVKYGWEKEEFVKALCRKAGAPFEMIKSSNVKIYKFQAFVFREKISQLEEYCQSKL